MLSSIDDLERSKQLENAAEADAAAAATAVEQRRLDMAAKREQEVLAAEAKRQAILAAPSQRVAAIKAGDTYVTRRVV